MKEKKKPKILIVEDENIIALDIKDSLENLGYIVTGIVNSGKDALIKAGEHRPDIVLMDIVLRGKMDGIEAACKIRERFNIPAVYITAFEDDELLNRAKKAVPFGYILKPFMEKELKIVLMMAYQQLRMEEKLREGEEILKISERNMKEFSRKLLDIREKEKKELSIDLHDEVGSMIVAMSMQLNNVENNISDKDIQSALKNIKETRSVLKTALKKLKGIASGLMPPHLDTVGFPDVLKDYVSNIAGQADFKIDLDIDVGKRKINEGMSIVLYRVTQEALNNIIKHADAKRVVIKLYFQKNSLNFHISDNGRGFDSESSRRTGRLKMGIWGMRERIESLGGRFILKSKPGKGTTIKVSIP